MHYENVETAKLIPYANNAKKHGERQIAQVAASIRQFGFISPIIIDKNFGIIAGHCRLAAAQKLELKEVPCLRVEHLSETQKKAYIIADNKLSELAEWDNELLSIEIEDLKLSDFDIGLTGFNEQEIDALTQSFEPKLSDDDEPDSKPTSYLLRIEFDNDDERQQLFFELRDRGLKVKV